MDGSEAAAGAVLNERELRRQLARHTRGARILEEDGLLLIDGPARRGRIASRTDPAVAAEDAVARTAAFFNGGGYTLRTRERADADLGRAALATGLVPARREGAMALTARPAFARLPAGIELRAVRGPEMAQEFGQVVVDANRDVVGASAHTAFACLQSMAGPHVAAFVAYDGATPVAAAMTLVSHGVAGIFWVATVPDARGRGLGGALTRAIANVGFDMGSRMVCLWVPEPGETLYEQIGFRSLGPCCVEYDTPS